MRQNLPFKSVYKEDFAVVEERVGDTTYFPHTQQLPHLLRALNLEFYAALAPRIARVDHRGNGWDKMILRMSAIVYCNFVNGSRADNLRLFPLVRPDYVTKVAIVQQITKHERLGQSHRFRYYSGDDFFPEIHVSGKRIVFSSHALDRFSTRFPNHVGTDLSMFLVAFFGMQPIVMPIPGGRALVLPYLSSLLVMPFKETEDEIFIMTCLTPNEVNGLTTENPPIALNYHYGKEFTKPRYRHWHPTKTMLEYYQTWKRRVPVPPPFIPQGMNWSKEAMRVKDRMMVMGHGPGSYLVFVDHIPGPMIMEMHPNRIEPCYDELEPPGKNLPKHDWDEFLLGTKQFENGPFTQPDYSGATRPEF